jgi:hypothetical protein
LLKSFLFDSKEKEPSEGCSTGTSAIGERFGHLNNIVGCRNSEAVFLSGLLQPPRPFSKGIFKPDLFF